MILSAVPLKTQPRGDPGSTAVGPGRHVLLVARRDWQVAFVGIAHSVQVSRSVPTTRDATGVLGDESGNSYARNCQPWGCPQRTPPTPSLRCCWQIVAVSPGCQAPNWRGAAVVLAIGHRVADDGTHRAVLDDRDAQLAWSSVHHRAVGGRSVPPRSVPPITVVTALVAGGRTPSRNARCHSYEPGKRGQGTLGVRASVGWGRTRGRLI
jgi:hypothetical protein